MSLKEAAARAAHLTAQGMLDMFGNNKLALMSGLFPAHRQLRQYNLSTASASPVPAASKQSSPRSWTLERQYRLPRIRGLLVDAAGTLVSPSEPAAAVYLRYGSAYGVNLSEKQVLQNFRRAYNTPWAGSNIRYVGDGKPFWRHIVAESTGCKSPEMFEEIYDYYQRPEAWKATPGAAEALMRLRRGGVRLAVVSNFDTRLRPLLASMGLLDLFHEVIVSAEVGYEKPCPLIFEEAVNRLNMAPEEVLHIGDDRRNDVWGARDAGITAWLWGVDVTSFEEVADKVLSGRLDI
mmetsp:Transcript_14977/g.32461  ORF Transcript_14977/g.32461 Transcript_14977/m.32461 type:complete len:292 (+) Transcript_14977:149-1024(+)|eukprot:CAMPEP_0202891170 /NCGR_PEP_ID=MMETSP1392-20130828/1307_1 /ASSEMBLY_ACC=CAM_ASM_000868 /TAXON_ID=225041 /ORGANISM="Chlamydomonas chlamydogama, Strain SAG 11-48b" /LENGTH=291 /DNA_ID=CAMNT_0049574853 /DNA_START=131 /DNA_END=1006 /DNA_ORIENTATION=+